MNPESLIPALVVLPMLGFLVTAVIGRRLGKQAHWVPVIAIFAVWVAAMILVVNVLSGTVAAKAFQGEFQDFQVKVGDSVLLARAHPSLHTPLGGPIHMRMKAEKCVAVPG